MTSDEERAADLAASIARLESEQGPHAHYPHLRFPLLEQLKRRNVFRVAALYVLVCWLILDPVHVVFHMLEVPVWANRLVVILMVAVFPAVLLFAWVFEVTPDGLKRSAEVPPEQSVRPYTGRRLDRAIIVVLALALAYIALGRFWVRGRPVSASRAVTITETAAPAPLQAAPSAVTAERGPAAAAAKLTDRDTIVLADFTNSTGDAVFDGTLRQGLAVQLEQSPFLSLISDQRIHHTLALMGQPPGTRLTPEVAREVCERTASAAVLTGSIAALGSQYVLGLHAESCRTGDILDEGQAQAAKKEDVLDALTQMARQFRTRIGESLATVRKYDTPLADASTPSLEALKAYSAGMQALATGGDVAAVPFLRRAVEIDPQFAMAHAHLGVSYNSSGNAALATQSNTRAYELRERASDAEKFFITSSYEITVTGNLEKARQTCELWAQTYPRDNIPHSLLSGLIYPVFGDYHSTLAAAQQGVARDPDFAIGRVLLVIGYQLLDRLDEAETALEQGAKRYPDFPHLTIERYELAFLKGDATAMQQALTALAGMNGTGDLAAHLDALRLGFTGRLAAAGKQSQVAVQRASAATLHDRAALFEAAAALRDGLYGLSGAAKELATSALARTRARDVEYGAALALALAGDGARAQPLADDLAKRFPEDTAVSLNYLPTLRAQLALLRGDPARAVELLQTAAPYELGSPPSSFFGYYGALYPVYVRGQADLAAGRPAEAAAGMRRILAHPGLVVTDPIGALAHLQLARALATSGDVAQAKAAYQDFLVLWKDADADVPVLKQARAEFARLPGS